ncbi:MAG: hypothetical protein ABIF10_08265 [Candidatus Woesearchaeota archaeon]
MRPKVFAVALVAAVAVAVSLTAIFYSFFHVVDIVSKPMKIIVDDYIGLDANSINLSFGAVPPGDSSHKLFTVRNVYGKDVRVKIKPEGEFRDWVSFSPNNFVLLPDESKQIKASAKVPENYQMNRTLHGVFSVVFVRSW